LLKPWTYSLAVLAVLLLVGYFFADLFSQLPGYGQMQESFGFWFGPSLRSIAEILIVVAALMVLQRAGAGFVLDRLGISSPPLPAFIFGIAAVVPLYVVFGFTMPLASETSFVAIAYLALLGPMAEEVLFRGFAFGELRRLVRLPFWAAALLPAVAFGLAHIGDGDTPVEIAGIFAITAAGGLFFSWLYEKWDYNIWVPIAVHVMMNLAWNIFEVGDSAFAGWLPTVMQVTTLILAIVLTLYWTPTRDASQSGSN